MAHETRTKPKTRAPAEKKLDVILKELRFLRHDVFMLLPHERLDEYAHPKKIRRAYLRAMKQYPPAV